MGWTFKLELTSFCVFISYWAFYISTEYVPFLIPSDVLQEMTATMPYLNKGNRSLETYNEALSLLASSAYLFRLLIPFLFLASLRKFKEKTLLRRFTRVLSREHLLKIAARRNPSLYAVIDQNILFNSLHKGKWAVAKRSIIFANEHQLLESAKGEKPDQIDAENWNLEISKIRENFPPADYLYLLRDKTDTLYRNTIGPRVRPLPKMKSDAPLRYLVFAGLLPFIKGGKKHRSVGMEYLHDLSRSLKGHPEYSDSKSLTIKLLSKNIPAADDLVKSYFSDLEIMQKLLDRHAFELTLLTGMFFEAKRKGKTVSSDLLWLRPIDRVLFYTLDQVGAVTPYNEGIVCPTPYPETAAIAAHFRIEKHTRKKQKTPLIEAATDALLEDLKKEKWVCRHR